MAIPGRRTAMAISRPVVAFQIRGRDAKKLTEFYTRMFNWDVNTDNPMSVPFITTGPGGPEAQAGTIFPGEPRVLIFVQVADLGASLAQAVELGGKRVQEPFDVPNGPTVAQIEDPEGNLVGLVQL
jgi:predicted enzyme related to lactoylglutathione lyase